MDQSIEESDLLGLIEDELAPADAESVRRKLAGHPDVLALVDQLRADRLLLQSMDEPALPRDFIGDLEPLLARPILMQASPGAYRRAHRRRSRGRRLVRLAAAAAVALLVIGGVWAAAVNLVPDGLASWRLAGSGGATPSRPEVAVIDETGAANGSGVVAEADLDGTIHHYQPLRRLLASARSPSPEMVKAEPGASGVTIAAPFAVVIDRPRAEIEAALAAVVNDGDEDDGGAALAAVRNFSYDEARDLQRRWALARAASPREAREPIQASADGRRPSRASDPSMEDLARRVREHLRDVERESASGAGTGSGFIAGDAEATPDYPQQLEFSSRGAAYTLCVPVERLRDVVRGLEGQLRGQTRLRRLDATEGAAVPEDAPALADWLAQSPSIRAALAELEASGPGTIVLLPVIPSDRPMR